MAELLALVEKADNAVLQEKAAKEAEQFLDRFVLPWFPLFAASVQEEDRDGFYRGLVELTDGLLQLTGETLEKVSASTAC